MALGLADLSHNPAVVGPPCGLLGAIVLKAWDWWSARSRRAREEGAEVRRLISADRDSAFKELAEIVVMLKGEVSDLRTQLDEERKLRRAAEHEQRNLTVTVAALRAMLKNHGIAYTETGKSD